ncbi:hypothetical protein IQ06DRAFT_290588 [Phaeosphaeriaceae sp. SRC1lsM3a]|nr:hypothetical protein IQ06DRAFT_290588 [Stagonospora sp. SRC1lsM3a]
MHFKFILGLLATIGATASALPTSDGVEDKALEARAITRWNASGGCLTNWGGRCNAACKAEAAGRGCRGSLGSSIDGADCTNPFKSTCRCSCET